jgi:hypothetical protein
MKGAEPGDVQVNIATPSARATILDEPGGVSLEVALQSGAQVYRLSHRMRFVTRLDPRFYA